MVLYPGTFLAFLAFDPKGMLRVLGLRVLELKLLPLVGVLLMLIVRFKLPLLLLRLICQTVPYLCPEVMDMFVLYWYLFVVLVIMLEMDQVVLQPQLDCQTGEM